MYTSSSIVNKAYTFSTKLSYAKIYLQIFYAIEDYRGHRIGLQNSACRVEMLWRVDLYDFLSLLYEPLSHW